MDVENIKNDDDHQNLQPEIISVQSIIDPSIITDPSSDLNNPTPKSCVRKKTTLEAFIKITGSRRVVVESLGENGEILESSAEQITDEPKVIKISSQEKIADDLSEFTVQEPKLFDVPVFGDTFTTSLTVKCPRLVPDLDNTNDPVFTNLKDNECLETNINPSIQPIFVDVKMTKNTKVPTKNTTSNGTSTVCTPKAAKRRKISKTRCEAQNSSPLDNILTIAGKRNRKPSKKVLEMRELEDTDKNLVPKTEKTDHGSEKTLKTVFKQEVEEIWENKALTGSDVIVPQVTKDEFELGTAGLEKLGENTVPKQGIESKLDENLKSVILPMESGDQILVASSNENTIPESIITVPDKSLLSFNSIPGFDNSEHDDDCDDTGKHLPSISDTDFTIFDDDVYEKKYGSKIKTPKLLSCSHCTTKFSSRAALIKHRRKHLITTGMNFEKKTCEICKKVFSSQYTYDRHMHHHQSQTADGKFQCNTCQKIYSSIGGLIKHQRSDKNCTTATYKCDYCHCMYSSQYSLEIHKRRMHIGNASVKMEICDHCGKSFETRGGLNKHKNSKTCKTTFTCEICEKVFNTVKMFTRHKNMHKTSPNETVCDICGKVLSSPSALMSHKNSHNNVRNYSCKICGKVFIQKGTLVAHERIHSGVKPYLCNVCGASFRYHSHLRSHSFIHEGNARHACSKCGRTFYQKQALKKHLMSHQRKERKKEQRTEALKLNVNKSETEYNIDISNVAVVPNDEAILFLNEVDTNDGSTQYIFASEDGQAIQGYSTETIVTEDDFQFEDGQNIVYQTADGKTVTFVDEFQTSDLNILAETAQNYKNSEVTYLIVQNE